MIDTRIAGIVTGVFVFIAIAVTWYIAKRRFNKPEPIPFLKDCIKIEKQYVYPHEAKSVRIDWIVDIEDFNRYGEEFFIQKYFERMLQEQYSLLKDGSFIKYWKWGGGYPGEKIHETRCSIEMILMPVKK